MVHGRMSGSLLARLAKYVAAIASIISFALSVGAAPKIESVPGEFLVKVKDAKVFTSKSVLSALNAEEVKPVLEKHNIFLVKRNILEKSDFSINSLAANEQVLLVEPNYIYRINKTPNDPMLGELWGLKNNAQKGGRAGIDISAEQAWDIQTGSREVIVAVIDTGIDHTHPDLKNNMWVNEAEKNGLPGVDDDGNGYVDDIYGYDFVNNDGNPMDDHGHGTHCAGTIGAEGDDGAGIVGVAWHVRLMGIKFLSAGGSGTLANAIKSIDYATKMGAHIQSNSWGGGGFTQLLKEAIERSRDKNALFVAAAGNESNDNDAHPSYPATYDVDNIVSVAALDNSGQLAYFSSYGKKTVHVAAPGVDVTSSVPYTTNRSGYDTWSGTSMATPHVAGAAALLVSQNPNITYAEMKTRIMSGARVMASLRNKVASAGLLNAYYTLTGETAPPDTEDPYNWATTAQDFATPTPYPLNYEVEFVVKVEGATQIAVFFEKFDTERGYDYVVFKDSNGVQIGKWSGKHNEEFSPVAQGDTIVISFKSDETVNGPGFKITKAAYR